MLFYWIWLFLQKGVGSRKIVEYYNKFKESFYKKNSSGLSRFYRSLGYRCDKDEIKDIKFELKSASTKVIPFWSKKYPQKLKNISDFPAFLFYRGNWIDFDDVKTVAVVGTRSMSNYGKNCVSKILKNIGDFEICVVSGLASGIDAEGHKVSNKSGAFPAAVLAGGPDHGFPEMNRSLYEDIVDEGCVLSEFFPGTSLNRMMFASRNRIIAGLSDIVVVVEAPLKSGALITADLALQYNRYVGAVPGSIFNQTSKGTNKLIKEGAFVIRKLADILNIYDINIDLDSEKSSRNMIVQKRLEKVFSIDEVTSEELVRKIQTTSFTVNNLAEFLSTDIMRTKSNLTKLEVEGILSVDLLGCINFNDIEN